jgi:phage shock protein PspC (stress-responsive transcriptional regulator)
MQRRLERSTTNRVISGVCGGLADYLAVDATLVRVFFVIATVVTAFLFILVYIVLLILMPLPGQRPPIDDIWPSARTGDPATGATDTEAGVEAAPSGAPPRPPMNAHDAERRRNTIGYVLVALGFVFLLGNLGAFRLVQWQFIWPLVFVALGVLLLVQRTRP